MLSVKRFTHELSGSSGDSDTDMTGLLELGFPFSADEQTFARWPLMPQWLQGVLFGHTVQS